MSKHLTHFPLYLIYPLYKYGIIKLKQKPNTILSEQQKEKKYSTNFERFEQFIEKNQLKLIKASPAYIYTAISFVCVFHFR